MVESRVSREIMKSARSTLGSSQPKTNLGFARRAALPAHIGQGSSVTYGTAGEAPISKKNRGLPDSGNPRGGSGLGPIPIFSCPDNLPERTTTAPTGISPEAAAPGQRQRHLHVPPIFGILFCVPQRAASSGRFKTVKHSSKRLPVCEGVRKIMKTSGCGGGIERWKRIVPKDFDLSGRCFHGSAILQKPAAVCLVHGPLPARLMQRVAEK